MFRISICTYFLLMNNTLPLFFNDMKSELPQVYDSHDIRHYVFQNFHKFSEQQIQYQITILNFEKCDFNHMNCPHSFIL